MLSAKTWRLDALVRFLISVFLCIFGGSLLATLPQLAGKCPSHAGVYYLVLVGGLAAAAVALWQVLSPWNVETLPRRLVVVGICFYLNLMCGYVAQRMVGPAGDVGIPHMVMATITFQGLTIPLVAWFLREHALTWSEGFGLRQRPGYSLLAGILGVILFIPLVWMLQYASGQILERAGFDALEQITVQALRLSESLGQRLSLALVSILIAPVAEELLFRGILYPAIRDAGFPRLAFWGTAALFAAIHLNAMTFIPLLVLALGLTYLYEKTGNLLAPVAAHAVFNTVNFIMLFVVEAADAL